MKPKFCRASLASFLSVVVCSTASQAADLYWDSNSTGTAGAGATPTGTWGTSVFWSTDSTGANIGTPTLIAATTNADDLFFVAGPGAASGNNAYTVTVGTTQVAKSLTFQASGATTLSGGTSITLGDGTVGAITLGQFAFGSTAQGAVTISTPMILSGANTWTNNAASLLSITGGLNLNGNALTIGGSGNTTLNSANISLVVSGAGGIIKNGTGSLELDAGAPNPVHTFTGGITVNGGRIAFQTATNVSGRGNVILNGGYLAGRFISSPTFSGLGTGSTAIQILGGNSGFSGEGASGSVFTIGTAGSVLQWGATGVNGATGFFNPTVLVAGGVGGNANGVGSLNNGINLSGTDRTITSTQVTDGAATSGFTISGVISNSTGTAGFEKTGVGNLILGNANTFNGALTISGGWITAGASDRLGNSSATNTLIFNGGILRATGTITSVATRGVTMTQTGIIDTNNQLVSIAGNIGGTGGLTKNGANTLTLSGTNTFGGVTTVNAGTLAVTRELALASNTAANLNIRSGATLALNVDSAGTAGFTATNLNTLLANISVANTASQGSQAGASIGIDTSTATGGTFTQGNAITNSTGAFGGVINFVKLGTGTLVFDKANTFTGNTTVSAGTLQFNTGGSVIGRIINNASIIFNQNASTGTAPLLSTIIGGTGSIAAATGNTITINTPTGLQFNGISTAGGGSFALNGSPTITTPTVGGLSGTTGNLSSAFSSGYDSVTNLILNTPSGTSFTYGGVINDGAVSMSVTKTGGGTQILTGTNTYTGATNINAGTLNLGGATATGSLASAVLNLGGGTLSYTRTGTNTQAFTTTNVNAGASAVSNSLATQTIALGSVLRPVVGGTVNFGTTGTITTSTIVVNGIIGGWATTNSDNWATKTGANITALGTYTATTNVAADYLNNNMDVGAASVVVGNINTNSLRFSGGSVKTLTLAAGDNIIQSGGILVRSDVANNLQTITGGNLAGSSGGDLIIHQYNATNSLTIASLIKDSTTATALTKSGPGNLNLTNASNSFSGGTVLNGGTLTATADANLGATVATPALIAAAQAITVNGNSQVNLGTATYNRSILLNNANLFFANGNTPTITGAVTGTGSITHQGGNSATSITLSSTSNTFTGSVGVGTGNGSSTGPTINVASLADSAGAGNIIFNYGWPATNATFSYMASAVAPLILNNRQIVVANNASNGIGIARIQNNNATNAITINTPLSVTTATAGTHPLALDAVAGPVNVFGGVIPDGVSGVLISLSKTGAGNWMLSGSNTYSGATNISGGTLRLAHLNAVSGTPSITMVSGTTLQVGTDTAFAGPRIVSTAGTIVSDRATTGAGLTHAFSGVSRLGSGNTNITAGSNVTSGTAAIQFASLDNDNGTVAGFGLNPTTANVIVVGGVNMGGGVNAGTANFTLGGTGSTNSIGGAIIRGNRATGNIIKSGTSIWALSGTGSDYNGSTAVNGGTLIGIGANAFGNTTGISIAAASAATLSLRGDSSTNFVTTTSSTPYAVTTTADGATINVDQATIAGTGAKTMTIGTLLINTAITNGTNFTGANNTSLSIGAVSTGNSVSGTETLTNNIASTGSLTLASIAVNRTTAPTLAFAGTGNTTVTGNITQVAPTILTKSGAGTLTLGGTSSYTGVTTVSAGTLAVTGSLGATAVSVNGTSTLAGNGNFGGNVTIGATATHSLAVAATPGAQDTSAITGTLTLTSGNTLNLTAAATPAAGEYVLATATTAITGPPTNINYNGITGTVTVDTVSNPKRLLLTVTGGDVTPPTLTSITDNVSGGPININAPVTYTVTFNEDMDASTFSTADFSNAGTASATIGAITETTPGVFTVVVTPTTSGTLILQIPTTATLTDVAANALDNDPALLDDTTITVRTLYGTWAASFLPGADVSNPALNFDGDGLTNLQEYAFGTNPTVSTGGSIEWVANGAVTNKGQPIAFDFSSGGGVDYRAVFGRRKDYAAAGLTYTAQFSADMILWQDAPVSPAPTLLTSPDPMVNTTEIDAVSVPYPSLFVPLDAGGFGKATFLRVKVAN